jgi:hypothetical protein
MPNGGGHLGFLIDTIFCKGLSNDSSCTDWIQSNVQFLRITILFIFLLGSPSPYDKPYPVVVVILDFVWTPRNRYIVEHMF